MSFFSCNDTMNKKQSDINVIDKKNIEDSMVEMNINLLAQESKMMDDYVNSHNLNMVKTGTGLRYQILEPGDGDLIDKGDIVSIEYEIRLLDDDVVYSSDKDGFKTFVVGKGGVESGLEEAILKLRKNSVAILIIPSYLAHGIAGDGNKIPQRASLVYKLKIIDNYSN